MLSKPVTNCDRFKFEMPIWHLKTIGFFSGEWVRFLTPKALSAVFRTERLRRKPKYSGHRRVVCQ
jgi:hypothetical protein